MREDDRKKFVMLAQKRVRRAINDIRLVGNLSNRSNYKYTDEDAHKIYGALRAALEDMKARFERRGDEPGITFSLEDRE